MYLKIDFCKNKIKEIFNLNYKYPPVPSYLSFQKELAEQSEFAQ